MADGYFGRSRAIDARTASHKHIGAVQDVPPFFADKRKKKKSMALPCFSLAYNIHGWMLYAQTKSGAIAEREGRSARASVRR